MCWARRSTCSANKAGQLSRRTILTLAALLGVLGCDALQPNGGAGGARPLLSPVLQRMRDTYEDLASGRFVSLADFESPGQELLFRCAGQDGTVGQLPQPTLSILRSRNETGAGGLKVRLTGAGDHLVLDGQRTTERALIRDWHEYALLLMSVYGPSEGAVLEFSVESGERTPLRWTRTIQVRPGWNLVRFDLATIGEWVNLTDVRALTWRAPQIKAPIDMYLDDLIIADNRQPLLGEQAGPGEMSVYTRGRRIYVGTPGRFELGFADGQIAAWRSGSDENLVDPDGLGPWPVPLPENWFDEQSPALAYDDPGLYASWGAAAAATQRVVEASAFRVLVVGHWRFAPSTAPKTDAGEGAGGVGHDWQYTIYPSGAVYVYVRSEAPAVGWAAPRVGYAIGLDGRRDFQYIAPPEGAPGTAPVRFAQLAQAGKTRADLVWGWAPTRDLERQRVLRSADERRLAVIAGDVAAAPVEEAAHLLRLWPPDIDAAPEGHGFAADYRVPAVSLPTAGSLRKDTRGDLNQDGFNEAEGTYEFTPEGGVLRFEFNPGANVRFDPVFRIHETAGRRCWVYARGRLVKDVGRDVEENLLFRLAPVVSTPMSVEVHVAASE